MEPSTYFFLSVLATGVSAACSLFFAAVVIFYHGKESK